MELWAPLVLTWLMGVASDQMAGEVSATRLGAEVADPPSAA